MAKAVPLTIDKSLIALQDHHPFAISGIGIATLTTVDRLTVGPNSRSKWDGYNVLVMKTRCKGHDMVELKRWDESGAETFVKSELFAKTFREGMALVEETADYLDGEGRKISKTLPRTTALAYAGASMRLTTQLMQIASWLLVLRAVREGDMEMIEAREEKYRLKTPDQDVVNADEGLPQDLLKLIEQANRVYGRIARLDAEIFTGGADTQAKDGDAAGQLRSLHQAFNA